MSGRWSVPMLWCKNGWDGPPVFQSSDMKHAAGGLRRKHGGTVPADVRRQCELILDDCIPDERKIDQPADQPRRRHE